MIESIERVRNVSIHDDWPNCDFCCQNFSIGFSLRLDDETIHVCDGCLHKAKAARFGWLKQESIYCQCKDTALFGGICSECKKPAKDGLADPARTDI